MGERRASRKDDSYAGRVLATVNFRNSIKHTDGDGGRSSASPCINHYLNSAQDLILHSRRSLYGGVSKRNPPIQGDNWVPGKWGEEGEQSQGTVPEEERDWSTESSTSLTNFEEVETDDHPPPEADDDLVIYGHRPSAIQSRPRLSIINSRSASSEVRL